MKEIAKFLCGWEACHGVFHAYFWFTGVEFMVAGIHFTDRANALTAVADLAISAALGWYAWRRPARPPRP